MEVASIILEIMNDASINIKVCEPFRLSGSRPNPSDIYPGMKLLGHMVVLCLFFWRKLHNVFHSDCTTLYSHR